MQSKISDGCLVTENRTQHIYRFKAKREIHCRLFAYRGGFTGIPLAVMFRDVNIDKFFEDEFFETKKVVQTIKR